MSYEEQMKVESRTDLDLGFPHVRLDDAVEIAREADAKVSECQAAIARLERALAQAGIRVTAAGEISADWFNGADGIEQIPLDEWLKRRREAAVMLSVVDPNVKNGLVQLNQALNDRLDRIRELEQRVEFWSRAAEEMRRPPGGPTYASQTLRDVLAAARDQNGVVTLGPAEVDSLCALLDRHYATPAADGCMEAALPQMAEVEAARVRAATPEMVTESPPCTNYAPPVGATGGGAVIGFSDRELDTHAVATEVAAERLRQIRDEGYTPGHDDEYALGELALGAAAYALSANGGDQTFKTVHGSLRIDYAGLARQLWPWRRVNGEATMKPHTRRRNLVKAAAMLMAEIERIDRANARTGT